MFLSAQSYKLIKILSVFNSSRFPKAASKASIGPLGVLLHVDVQMGRMDKIYSV